MSRKLSPRKGHIEISEPNRRRAGNDPIEIPRKSLRLLQCLATAGGTPSKIRMGWRLLVERLSNCFACNSSYMRTTIAPIHHALQIVVGPHGIFLPTRACVSCVRDDAGVTL